MTNEIKQVLFCYDEKDPSKILGFAVQRENRIERLDYNENNWNKIVRELMVAYPSDIEGLNSENEDDRNEIVRRFQRNNRIKVVNKDIIVALTKYESDDVNAQQFEVQYVSGKTRAFGRADYLDDIAYNTELENYNKEFTETYGLASGEIIRTVNVTKEKINANPVAPVATPVSRPPVTPRPAGTIKKNSKKILALAMGGTVLVGSLIGIGYFAGKGKSKVSLPEPTATPYFVPLSEITPVPTPIPTPSPVPTPTPTSIPTPTPTPTPRPTATSEPVAWRPAPTQFPIDAVNPEDSNLLLRVMTPELDTLVSFDDLMSGPFDIAGQEYDSYYLNYEYLLQEISNYESSLLSNYLHNNDDLPERAHLVYFENLFYDDPVDKAFIQYFSDLRNEIVYQLYRVNDKEKAKECTKFALYQLLRCYVNHEPLEIPVNGQIRRVRLEELTPEAQTSLMEISYSFYLMQGREKVFFNDSALDYKAIGWNLFGLEPEEEYGSK